METGHFDRHLHVGVDVMVGSGPLEGQEGLRASEFFSPALFERTHLFVVVDFGGEVRVRDGDLGWNMGHDVSVVNDPKVVSNLRREKGGELFISHSRLSHAVKLIDFPEDVLDVQSCNSGQSSSQRKACHVNFRPLIFLLQGFDLFPHVSFYSLEGIVETFVNETALAVWVGDLLGIQVSDPVLDVNSASECHNNGIELLRVTSITKNVQNIACETLGLNEK